MKKTYLFFTVLLSFVFLAAQQEPEKKPHWDVYIEKYSGYAVEEMLRSGVPASITLAQGMLESDYGRSYLAVNANNHFGIMCHDSWDGDWIEAVDAGLRGKFRVYKTALGSYEDHSDFLRANKRYRSLFELDRYDYKGWAIGLDSAGYALDSTYATKLISIIERYDLTKFDHMTKVPSADKDKPKKEKKPKREKKDRKDRKSASVRSEQKPVVVVTAEQEEPLNERQRKSYRYNLAREMYSQNGVPFIYSCGGESYSDIARQYDLFLGEILKYNDASEDCELPVGSVVYLQAKKNKAAKGFEEYVVEEGMGLWEISQKFAVKVKKLRQMNGFAEDHVPAAGDVIVLR